MKTRGGGSIVNIGSVNAYIGAPKLGPYSVSKGGLMTMTRNAASALKRYRIRVNQLNVGLDADRRRGPRAAQGRQARANWLADAVATRPFGRLLTPRGHCRRGGVLRVGRQRADHRLGAGPRTGAARCAG